MTTTKKRNKREENWRKKFLSSEEILQELQSEIMIIPSLPLLLSDTYTNLYFDLIRDDFSYQTL